MNVVFYASHCPNSVHIMCIAVKNSVLVLIRVTVVGRYVKVHFCIDTYVICGIFCLMDNNRNRLTLAEGLFA